MIEGATHPGSQTIPFCTGLSPCTPRPPGIRCDDATRKCPQNNKNQITLAANHASPLYPWSPSFFPPNEDPKPHKTSCLLVEVLMMLPYR